MVLAGLYAVLVAAGRMGPRATRPLRDRPTIAAVMGLAVLGHGRPGRQRLVRWRSR